MYLEMCIICEIVIHYSQLTFLLNTGYRTQMCNYDTVMIIIVILTTFPFFRDVEANINVRTLSITRIIKAKV